MKRVLVKHIAKDWMGNLSIKEDEGYEYNKRLSLFHNKNFDMWEMIDNKSGTIVSCGSTKNKTIADYLSYEKKYKSELKTQRYKDMVMLFNSVNKKEKKHEKSNS